MTAIRVRLAGEALEVQAQGSALTAIPSMRHPDFQHILESGWVSPPSFGPQGDLRIYSAAHSRRGETRYAWFASADWRRGRLQVDRRGAISDVAMEPYGGGHGKLSGEPVEVALDYSLGTASVTVGEQPPALGTWNSSQLVLERGDRATDALDEAFACALFLWCARPPAFLVTAKPPFER